MCQQGAYIINMHLNCLSGCQVCLMVGAIDLQIFKWTTTKLYNSGAQQGDCLFITIIQNMTDTKESAEPSEWKYEVLLRNWLHSGSFWLQVLQWNGGVCLWLMSSVDIREITR